MKKYMITAILLLAALFARGEQADTIPEQAPAPAAQTETTAHTQTEEPTEEERPETLWDDAATAYINGKYHKAVEIYNRLVERNLSSYALYYNLGNAYFKENEVAKAILYYHRALRLAPGEEDIRYNLSVAETKVKDTIEKLPEFFLAQWFNSLRRTMSCTAWTVLSLAALAAALGLFLTYLLARRMSLRKTGFYGTLAALTLFVAAGWFAAEERRSMLDRSEAVVMVSSLAVKSSPDRSATDLFVLHEGTTLKIRNRLDGWCEITIADGKKGWIEERKIEVI